MRLLPLLLTLAAAACADGQAEPGGEVELTVSAAASLREALEEIAGRYEESHPGVRVRLNFASSGTLQQQIRHGAPVDVFLSAAQRPMDDLEARGLILPETRRVFASNELVLVVPRDAPGEIGSFRDLAAPRVRRVAIGAPASVPAGSYAVEALRGLGLEEAVRPKTIQGQHVRQVLAYVERGEVDAGIVYRSDAERSERVRVVAAPPPGSHTPITYPLAVVAGSESPDEARGFAHFLTGPEARAVLRRLGLAPTQVDPEEIPAGPRRLGRVVRW